MAFVSFIILKMQHKTLPIAKNDPELKFDLAAKLSIYALVVSFVLTIAIAMTLSRSITTQIVTESKLIESGCRLASAYKIEYNIVDIKAKYYPMPKRNGIDHRVYLEHPGRRTIQVNVTDLNAAALLRIAPETMRLVAARMRLEGEHVPEPLRSL